MKAADARACSRLLMRDPMWSCICNSILGTSHGFEGK